MNFVCENLKVTHYVILVSLIQVIGVAIADHTTFCIALPGLTLKHNQLKSTLDYFPQAGNPAVNWSLLDETVKGRLRSSDFQRIDISPVGHQYPNGDLNIYRIRDDKNNQYLNGWYRVEFKLFATAGTTRNNPAIKHAVKALILQVIDDDFRGQHIGEFVWNFPTSPTCPASDATKYMVISCGGASRADPLVANTILFVRKNPKDGDIFPSISNNKVIVPDLDDVRNTLNFYVRIPIQACNTKNAIYFQARVLFDRAVFDDHIFHKNVKAHMISKVIAVGQHTVPGGTDALPSPADAQHLDCSHLIDKYHPNYHIHLNPTLPWFSRHPNWDGHRYHGAYSGILDYSDGMNNWFSSGLIGCQANYFEGRCQYSVYEFVDKHANVFTTQDLKALAEILNQNEALPHVAPICESTQDIPHSTFGKMKYVGPKKYFDQDIVFSNTQVYLRSHNIECDRDYNTNPTCVITSTSQPPGGPAAAPPPSPPPGPPGNTVRRRSLFVAEHRENTNDNRGRSAEAERSQPGVLIVGYLGNNQNWKDDMVTGVRYHDTGFTLIIWGMRKGHAIFMVMITFLIIPVNQFFTRYMKESFMNRRILYTRVWYIVHAHGTFLTIAFLTSAIIIIKLSQEYLGVSLNIYGTIHRILGWFCIALYLLMAVLGGFRGLEEPWRRISIMSHWLVGFTTYICMLTLCCLAVFIPGSGISAKDTSSIVVLADEVQGSNGAFIFVFVWVIVDVIFHAIMSFLMMSHDARMGIINKRLYLPVPIPVLKERSSVNATGHGLRVIVLCSYIGVSICAFLIYLIAFIANVSWRGKGLGPMSCTHEYNATSKTFEILEKFPEFC